MAASCSAGGELVTMVKASSWFITLDLDLPSVAIPNISFSVLTSEKLTDHHKRKTKKKYNRLRELTQFNKIKIKLYLL